MKEIMRNWRAFSNPGKILIRKRLVEAITRRQFLSGGAAAGLLYALMNTEFFKQASEEEQNELIELSPEELARLSGDVNDPKYAKAVMDYEQEEQPDQEPKGEYEGLSDKDIKLKQFEKVGSLMIAPKKLENSREWSLAPTSQSQTGGYYAYATEADLDSIASTNPEISSAVNQAYEFYKDFGITRLHKYIYGQPEFFSYTSAEEANAGKTFDTITTDRKQRNYLTGELQNIRFRKLPLAWTLAQRVLVDQFSLMEYDLQSAKSKEEVEAVFEKYGLGPDYIKNKTVSKEQVYSRIKKSVDNTLSRMDKETPISGKHSN
tara:strand:- start:566 stop:1522 length:957 start_codon:yes stop_codon:yes gene_type:complete